MYTSLSPFVLIALIFSTVLAAPLNINMGNFSPALVVGDGAIAFDVPETGAKAVEAADIPSIIDAKTGGTGNFQPLQAGVEGIGRKVVPQS
ncbi:unnamed protein product [Blumeria hordei]|uniref:Uncharacterized protein n=2 Tax=Blumeria hordei TaxID=2867405 RepID=A0A383V212_BLUHO|nr:CSEP0051 putative effector protein [Blumeria hordei DH14]SZF06026.1 unnamed protein product [Blumeria hordei]